MPRTKRYDPSGKQGPTRPRNPAGPGVQPPPSPLVPPPPSPVHATTADAATTALAGLVFRADGRYSVNAHESGHTYHKWRWSAGPLAGRYVMFVASRWDTLPDGILGLVDKVLDAEAGRLSATLDRYH